MQKKVTRSVFFVNGEHTQQTQKNERSAQQRFITLDQSDICVVEKVPVLFGFAMCWVLPKCVCAYVTNLK